MDRPINAETEVMRDESELDQDTLREIMVTGENTEGLFTPEPELDDDGEVKAINEEIDEEAVVTSGKVTKKYGDYLKKFSDDMEKNPGRYMISTPRGRMSITEALKSGFDPATGDFTEQTEGDVMEADLAGLPPEEAEAIRAMTNPNRANEEPPAGPAGQPSEEELAMLAMQQAGAGGPQAQPQPGEPATPGPATEAEPNIAALLGGGQ